MHENAWQTRRGDPGLVAVVLAGGDSGDRLAQEGGVAAKALIPIAGQPMGAYVLRALRACEAVHTTIYVGPTSGVFADLYDVTVPGGERLVDSLAVGLGAALGLGAASVLLLSADVPWIDGPMIDRFVDRCAAAEPADLYYPVVSEAAYQRRFPDHERTFVRLRDGRFTGANLALLSRDAVPSLLPLIDRVYRGRKNPVTLASIMGVDVLASLLLGTLSIDRLERRAAGLLGYTAKAVVVDDPELAADVDRPTHLPGVLDPELPSATGGSGSTGAALGDA